jgi:hypothetical protein
VFGLLLGSAIILYTYAALNECLRALDFSSPCAWAAGKVLICRDRSGSRVGLPAIPSCREYPEVPTLAISRASQLPRFLGMDKNLNTGPSAVPRSTSWIRARRSPKSRAEGPTYIAMPPAAWPRSPKENYGSQSRWCEMNISGFELYPTIYGLPVKSRCVPRREAAAPTPATISR